jgi:UTP:GlnB (protein PII) uridylyltransferase
LVVCDIDVVNAEAFTRKVEFVVEGSADGDQDSPKTNTRFEAMDLFWLRKVERERSLPLESQDLERLRTTLVGLLDQSLPLGQVPSAPSAITKSESRVRFIEDEEGALSTLEIETEDRSGLLLSVSRALFGQNVQVVRCEVRTDAARRVVDRFKIAERDGAPVGPARRLEIQVAVLSAIEPAKRLGNASTPPPAG